MHCGDTRDEFNRFCGSGIAPTTTTGFCTFFFLGPSSIASKLKSVTVGGASFLDILSRAFRRSNADFVVTDVVFGVVDLDLKFVLSFVPRMLTNGRFMHPLAPVFFACWTYGFCRCNCCCRFDEALCFVRAANDRLPRLAVARRASAAR
jgi:hypothetical protein